MSKDTTINKLLKGEWKDKDSFIDLIEKTLKELKYTKAIKDLRPK